MNSISKIALNNTVYDIEDKEARNSYKPNLLEFKWSDHILNDIQWLRADTFSWQDGGVYEAAYNHLVEDYNNLEQIKTITYDNRVWVRDSSKDDNFHNYYAWTNQSSTVFTIEVDPTISSVLLYYSEKEEGYISYGTVIESVASMPMPQTETIGSYTITYYVATDGHKIVLEDQAQTVQDIYNETGVAWYFILDTTNQRFKLPRTKYGFTGLRDTVGKYVEAGLPNITGTQVFVTYGAAKGTSSGAFTNSKSNSYANCDGGGGAYGNSTDLVLDASLSNPIYGNSTTVQPPATEMYLYFYVGDYTQTALEQTAGLNAELFNGKLNTDLSNMNPSQTVKNTIVGWAMPDYSAGVNKGWNNFTVDFDGILYCYSGVNESINTVSVNGSEVYRCGNNSYVDYNGALVPVSKNDVVTVSGGTYGVANIILYPLKGAN